MDPLDPKNVPDPASCPTQIDSYKILKILASGGMGEVFLAYDPLCDRSVALKKIRRDLLKYATLKERFLREAKIAALLAHPSIIPIYSIHQHQEEIYYTMPYVEGETLKQILRHALDQEKTGELPPSHASSLPALMRIFFSVCQAIAYCHSKGILHRDLKPENIIVGKYGEVVILDWGLADFIEYPVGDFSEKFPSVDFVDLTQPGKIPGTLAYIPPERILGKSSSSSTDIYALGVILYQLLTLRLPFQRTSAKKLRKQIEQERFVDPAEKAPYRDVPLELANMAKKCLDPNVEARYPTVNALLQDVENYMEGRGQWIFSASMDISQKTDWEFQENILLAKHIAITRSTDVMEWVNLMISKKSFSGNMKIETTVRLGSHGKGIGFLLNIPEAQERKGLLEDGYCLWIGSEQDPGCFLSRSNVEILSNPEICLQAHQEHLLRIERVDNHLRFYLDDRLILDYLTHIPLSGPHFGFLLRDADLQVDSLSIYVSSQNITVNCLAVPDAFLANKNFAKALLEYKRIATSFPGRTEGREALFRSGITLLEEAQNKKRGKQKTILLHQALEEFGKLRSTPGAPLEYLGKSLVYKATMEIEEEIKCLELALRKYSEHPLLPLLHEEVVFRLHEASYRDRPATYHFALLSLRHLPQIFIKEDNVNLIQSLQKHWEPLDFIEPLENPTDNDQNTLISIQLAFWLAKPTSLVEILENTSSTLLCANALFCLIELGCLPWVEENIHFIKEDRERLLPLQMLLSLPKLGPKKTLDSFFSENRTKLSFSEKRALRAIIEQSLVPEKAADLLSYFDKILSLPLSEREKQEFTALKMWVLLLCNEGKKAESLEETLPPETQNHYCLKGCLLALTQTVETAQSYFSKPLEIDNPSSSFLLGYYLQGAVSLTNKSSLFFWEKMALLKQIVLFYHCAKLGTEAKKWQKRLTQERKSVYSSYSSP